MVVCGAAYRFRSRFRVILPQYVNQPVKAGEKGWAPGAGGVAAPSGGEDFRCPCPIEHTRTMGELKA